MRKLLFAFLLFFGVSVFRVCCGSQFGYAVAVWDSIALQQVEGLQNDRVLEDEGEILPEAARIGVGVGLGKMQLGEILSPGGVYKLPKLPVINTGLAPGTFQVRADLVTGPVIVNKESVSGWVHFSPAKFDLNEGQSRLVETELTLPFDAPPGDYLVYLEASMVRNSGMAVSLSPAAATKLYFSVHPSSVLGAYRARFLTFIETNPVIYLILAVLLLIEAGLILRRHWRFRIETRK